MRAVLRNGIASSASAGFLAISLLMVCAGLAPEARADSNSIALVMEMSGATTPPLSVHREIAPGTRIDLAPGTRISLLHYPTCTIVTLKGGSATVTDDAIEAKPADVESNKPGPCPRIHKITRTGPGPLGGVVVTRGEPKLAADVAADSDVILSGNAAADAIGVQVLDANHQPIDKRFSVRNAAFTLDGTLEPGRSYLFRISFSGQHEPLNVPVLISPSSTANLLVIRLD